MILNGWSLGCWYAEVSVQMWEICLRQNEVELWLGWWIIRLCTGYDVSSHICRVTWKSRLLNGHIMVNVKQASVALSQFMCNYCFKFLQVNDSLNRPTLHVLEPCNSVSNPIISVTECNSLVWNPIKNVTRWVYLSHPVEIFWCMHMWKEVWRKCDIKHTDAEYLTVTLICVCVCVYACRRLCTSDST